MKSETTESEVRLSELKTSKANFLNNLQNRTEVVLSKCARTSNEEDRPLGIF